MGPARTNRANHTTGSDTVNLQSAGALALALACFGAGLTERHGALLKSAGDTQQLDTQKDPGQELHSTLTALDSALLRIRHQYRWQHHPYPPCDTAGAKSPQPDLSDINTSLARLRLSISGLGSDTDTQPIVDWSQRLGATVGGKRDLKDLSQTEFRKLLNLRADLAGLIGIARGCQSSSAMVAPNGASNYSGTGKSLIIPVGDFALQGECVIDGSIGSALRNLWYLDQEERAKLAKAIIDDEDTKVVGTETYAEEGYSDPVLYLHVQRKFVVRDEEHSATMCFRQTVERRSGLKTALGCSTEGGIIIRNSLLGITRDTLRREPTLTDDFTLDHYETCLSIFQQPSGGERDQLCLTYAVDADVRFLRRTSRSLKDSVFRGVVLRLFEAKSVEGTLKRAAKRVNGLMTTGAADLADVESPNAGSLIMKTASR